MEYQQKKQEILQKVQYHNLLSFSLVQNKLQRNFRSIVDALLLNQTHQVGLRDDLNHLQQKTTNDHNNLQSKVLALQKAMQNMENRPVYQQTNKSQHNIDQASNKEILNSIKTFPEQNKQTKGQIEKLKEEIEKLKNKLTDGNYLQNLISNMQKDIAQMKGELATIGQNRPSIKEMKRSSIIKDISNSFAQKQSSSKIQEIKNKVPIKNSNNFINNENNQDGLKQTEDAELADKIDKEFNSLYIEINTLKLGYEQLRENCSGLNKKQVKQTNVNEELKQGLKRLEKQAIVDNENYEKQFKNLNLQIMNLQNLQRNDSSQNKQSSSNGKVNSTKEFQNVNFKNQLNDKFSKLQTMIQACISQAEFNRFKKQTRDKFDNVEANANMLKQNMEEEFRKVYELIDAKGYDIQHTKKAIDELKELLDQKTSQLQRKNNICLSKIQQLKKNLQNLRQDMEFYQSMQIQTSQIGEKNSNINQNIANQEDKVGKKDENQNANNKNLEQLKKSLTNKIQDQRIYLLGLIRDLERRFTPKGSVEQDIVNLLEKISEINLFLGKKADQQDTKKSLAYLEKKLGMLASNFMSNQDNTQDARVARTNWFCLSCDKNLHNYAGKVGRHIVWDTLPMRSNGSKFIVKEQKKALPVLKR